MIKTKNCSQCKNNKLLINFHKNSSKIDGLQDICKECRKYNYKNNKLAILEKSKSHYINNSERINTQTRKYAKSNLKQTKKYKEKWYQKHKNTKKFRQRSKQNKIKFNINNPNYYKQYMKSRRENDTMFKLLDALRRRINNAVKGNTKSLSTMFLIGCEIDYLMYHLQNQFTDGMTWDNYGNWHIDHIKPCASFDLSKPEEQRKCFNYKNLQPLWAIDNIRKGSNYVEKY